MLRSIAIVAVDREAENANSLSSANRYCATSAIWPIPKMTRRFIASRRSHVGTNLQGLYATVMPFGLQSENETHSRNFMMIEPKVRTALNLQRPVILFCE